MTQLESKSQRDDLKNLQGDSQQSTNLNSKASLIRRLKKGRDARTRFVESHTDKKLAFQIRSLRGDSSQGEIAKITGIKQQVLSRLESPYYGKPTLTTLKKLAAAYDVGLLVEFVPFSELVNRVSGTPYIERGFGPDTMNVPSFEEEEKKGTFIQVPVSPEAVANHSSQSSTIVEFYRPPQTVSPMVRNETKMWGLTDEPVLDDWPQSKKSPRSTEEQPPIELWGMGSQSGGNNGAIDGLIG